MNVSIVRTRYVIIRNNNEIFCGLARHYQFKPINDIGDTAVKTYVSEAKAKSSFISSWWHGDELLADGTCKVVAVTESIISI